jgi:methionine-rich copper-binding protein CopC
MKIRIVTAIAILSSLTIAPAQAHTWMTDSNPKKNVVVQELPDKLWIEFAEDLLVLPGQKVNTIVVSDSSGIQIDNQDSIVGGARITVTLKNAAQPGKIRVDYRIAAGDGHVLTDSYYFTYLTQESSATAGTQNSIDSNVEKSSSPQPTKPSATSSPSSVIKTLSPHANNLHIEKLHGENFLGHHTTHIIQTVVAIAVIILWWSYRRFSSKL